MLLAVDTSTTQVGLAVCQDQQVLAESIWSGDHRHTVELAPAVSELLRHAGLTIDSLQAIGVAIGPGSYTALRVGLAFAKGLSLARGLPIIGIATLDILAAAQQAPPMCLAAALQAGRGRIALGWYRYSSSKANDEHPLPSGKGFCWESDGPIQVTTVESLCALLDRPTVVAGELTGEDRQMLESRNANAVLAPPHMCVRRPSVLAELALEQWRQGKDDDPRSLAPVYLQLNEAIRA